MDSVKTQKDYIKERIPFEQPVFGGVDVYEKVIERLYDDSKYIALSLKYPYKDFSNMELPKKYNNWQLRCCEEIYKNIGNEGIKSYSENGLAWTRDSGNLSTGLVNEIEPVVGYIMVEEEIDNVQTEK